MWSTSSFPGSTTTSPVYGPVHLPAATRHDLSPVNVTGTEDSAISTSWRVSWQSPSASVQWSQSSLSYLGSPCCRPATTTLMTTARGCPGAAVGVAAGCGEAGGIVGVGPPDETGTCSGAAQPASNTAMAAAATSSRRTCVSLLPGEADFSAIGTSASVRIPARGKNR